MYKCYIVTILQIYSMKSYMHDNLIGIIICECMRACVWSHWWVARFRGSVAKTVPTGQVYVYIVYAL